MKKTLLIILSCLPLSIYPQKQVLENYYQHLDSVIAEYLHYREQINHRIDSLRTRLSLTDSKTEAFRLNIEIGRRYSWYMGDSALSYYNKADDIIKDIDRQDLKNILLYHKFRLLTEMGLLMEANDVYRLIQMDDMPDDFKASCDVARLLMTFQQWRLSGTFPVEDQRMLIKQLQSHITPQDTINDIWALYWSEDFDGKLQMIGDAFEKRFRKLVSRQDVDAGQMLYYGTNSYALSHEEYIRRLCLSTEYKIKLGDNSLSPLIDLVHILMNEGDYTRANNYLSYVLKVQAEFPDRTRSNELASLVNSLSDVIIQVQEREQRNTTSFLAWLSIAFGLVLLLLGTQMLSFRKLRKQSKEISDYNNQLNDKIAELSAAQQKLSLTNDELNEANFIKEEYIGGLFSSCSAYIDKLEAFRLNINRKAKTGKMEDILRYTAPDSPLLQSEIKELNQSFDKTFLTIYPNFVTDLNTLLKDDCQISVKEGKLNTELRICALIWLGIESSSKIASLLHVAPKTIYNANTRLRGMLKYEVPTTELFISVVRALGRENATTKQKDAEL